MSLPLDLHNGLTIEVIQNPIEKHRSWILVNLFYIVGFSFLVVLLVVFTISMVLLWSKNKGIIQWLFLIPASVLIAWGILHFRESRRSRSVTEIVK